MSTSFKIAVLAGDGIGPEVMAEALKVLAIVEKKSGVTFEKSACLVGGIAIDETGTALPEQTLKTCDNSEAILFGSVGGPKWEKLAPSLQPERAALLPLRKRYELFANLRPAVCFPSLTHASPLRFENIEGGFNILCVRELTGGLYFGQPKYRREEQGEMIAVDTMVYKKSEIVRIAHVAFSAARQRRKLLTSVDKANVLENGVLWRETVAEVSAEYPDVTLQNIYVDNAAMQLIKRPRDFDVILAENLFGDILSDELAMTTGSLGMLPSASLGTARTARGCFGMYEPSGGTAPDIAGMGVANPIAQILSVGMMLRHSFGMETAAAAIDGAIGAIIASGLRTRDIAMETDEVTGTCGMGDAVCAALNALDF